MPRSVNPCSLNLGPSGARDARASLPANPGPARAGVLTSRLYSYHDRFGHYVKACALGSYRMQPAWIDTDNRVWGEPTHLYTYPGDDQGAAHEGWLAFVSRGGPK